jgi:malonyl CoA-acyl carrier protein transacylase
LELDNPIFLEVGPGRTLTTLIKQQGSGQTYLHLAVYHYQKRKETEYHNLMTLWANCGSEE